MNPAPPIPQVVSGTLLQLGSDDWSLGRDLTPGSAVDVVVVRLRTDLAHLSDEWVWVVGHRPECLYPSTDEYLPCMELRVRLAALRRYASAT